MCKDQPRDEKTGRFQRGPPNATAFKKGDPRAADCARKANASQLAKKRGRDLLREVLALCVSDPMVKAKLKEAGFADDEITNELAMHIRQIERAQKTGDPRSYTAVMRAAGYDDQDVNLNLTSESHRPVTVRFVDCGDDGCGKQ